MSFFFEVLVCMASYGQQIDQSHGENRLSHIISIMIMIMIMISIIITGVKKHNIEISLWFKRWVQWWSCWRVHILVWVLLQGISDLIRVMRMVQRKYVVMYEFCFTCFKVECKRLYIFQSSSNETIIEI